MKEYLFKSERLGFRNWRKVDLPKMARISGNSEVMKYFPETATIEQTEAFITRMQEQIQKRGHCYFAVDGLTNDGFIGLCYQDFESEHTPFVDIGWRLAPEYWNKG